MARAKKEIDLIPIWWQEPYYDTADPQITGDDKIGFVFWLNIFDPSGIFECTTDVGSLEKRISGESPNNLTLKSGGHLGTWGGEIPIICVPFSWCYDGEIGAPIINQAFISILLKMDNAIIGYIVVEAYLDYDTVYSARLLSFKLNQKEDGVYHCTDELGTEIVCSAMDEEEVNVAIEQVKEEQKNKQ